MEPIPDLDAPETTKGKPFGRFVRFAPTRTPARFLLLWADVIVLNLIFYAFVKSVLLAPLGYHSGIGVMMWAALFIAAVYLFYSLQPWIYRHTIRRFLFQLIPVLLFVLLVSLLAGVSIHKKGLDFSWIRVEVIKVPLWIGMFVKLSPVFTIAFLLVISYLMFLALTRPRSKTLRVLPGVAAALLIWTIFDSFSGLVDWQLLTMVFGFAFGAPLFAFGACMLVRSFGPGFRLVPLMFHMMLMGLNYIGVLPVQSISDAMPLMLQRGDYIKDHPGVTTLFPPPGTHADSTFAFLRAMVLAPQQLYVNYGPTCGLYAIDRTTGASQHLTLPGLIRDMQLSPDGSHIWATNWKYADFVTINRDPFEVDCNIDLFELGISTPYSFIIDGDKVYVSNVTYPIVAELYLNTIKGKCSVSLGRKLNFWKETYTQFTDGAFGMHLDRARNRLYVLVGMLEGTDNLGLVEIDLETFTIQRDIRLPTGATVIPVKGRNAVLLPSYYRSEIYEVSTDTMQLVRTIAAAPTIVSIEHDVRRGLFYATSRSAGTLLVIDDASGKTLKRVPVGNKSQPLLFDPITDQLFVGSKLGVFRIDLELFLADTADAG